MTAPDLPLAAAPDSPSQRTYAWLWPALTALPAVILLGSANAYGLAGLFGMLLFLPMGALPWLLVWLSLLATALLLSPLFEPLAAQLAPRLGLEDGLRDERRHRLRRVTWLLLGVGVLTGLGLGTPSRSSSLPLCDGSDVFRAGASFVGALMGHGQVQKPRACRTVAAPQPGPWLPLLVSLPLLLALRRVQQQRWQAQLDAERLALRPKPPGPGQVAHPPLTDAPGPGSSGAAAPSVTLPDSIVNVPKTSADPTAAASEPLPPAVARSARTEALLEARRRASRGDASKLRGALLTMLQRWPVLVIGVGCYLLGWVLEIAGSALPLRIAEALSPAFLRHTFGGWPTLGLWASALVAFAVGALLSWLGRSGE